MSAIAAPYGETPRERALRIAEEYVEAELKAHAGSDRTARYGTPGVTARLDLVLKTARFLMGEDDA